MQCQVPRISDGIEQSRKSRPTRRPSTPRFLQFLYLDKVVDMTVVLQRQVPRVSDGIVEDSWKSRPTRRPSTPNSFSFYTSTKLSRCLLCCSVRSLSFRLRGRLWRNARRIREPQFEDQTVEVVKTTPQERFSKRTKANRRRASTAR